MRIGLSSESIRIEFEIGVMKGTVLSIPRDKLSVSNDGALLHLHILTTNDHYYFEDGNIKDLVGTPDASISAAQTRIEGLIEVTGGGGGISAPTRKTAAEFASEGIKAHRDTHHIYGTKSAPCTDINWAINGGAGAIEDGGSFTIYFQGSLPTMPASFDFMNEDVFEPAGAVFVFDGRVAEYSPQRIEIVVSKFSQFGAQTLTEVILGVGSDTLLIDGSDPSAHTNNADASPIADGESVKILGDATAANNHFTQTLAARQAVYRASEKMFEFDSADDGYVSDNGDITYPLSCTVTLVVDLTTTDNKIPFGKDASNYMQIENTRLTFSKNSGLRQISTTAGWLTGKHVFSIRSDGTTLEVFLDGGTTADVGTKYWTLTGAALTGNYVMDYIGSLGATWYNHGDKFHEKLGLLNIKNTRCNDSQIAAIHSAVMAEFSIT